AFAMNLTVNGAITILVLLNLWNLAGCATVDQQQRDRASISSANSKIGGTVDKFMDNSDRQKLVGALRSSHIGLSSTWNNSRTGYIYVIEITRVIEINRSCREYKINANIGGRKEEFKGAACQLGGGDWKYQKYLREGAR
ncbi:MAG: RT0821/Lpp0805 family surface protein, partial [Gammaproteobacteria bacterium]|nr:RT0821/Lpp0805 family surface protein [Gammaproteobacteria bacterium]